MGVIGFLFAIGLILFVIVKLWSVIWRLLVYAVISIPVWAILLFVPGFLDEGGFAIFLVIMAFVRGGSTSGGGGYVLNKKTGVIHDIWSSSADTISEKHRKTISFSEAEDLVNRGTKYHFKK